MMRIRSAFSCSLGLLSLIAFSTAVGQNAQYGLAINSFAGGATTVCAAATNPNGDGCPAAQAILNSPYIGASDSNGNFYIPDLGIGSGATPVVQYVARIRRVDAHTGIITTVAGGAATVCAAATNTLGDGCPATQAILSSPRSVAIDAAGDIYIADPNTADSTKAAVRMVDARTGIITTVLGTGSSGNGPFNNANPPAGKAVAVGNVNGLILDKAGNLYISQSNQYYVLMELAGTNGQVTSTSFVYTLAGTGTKGFGGDGGPSGSGLINSARGLGIDLAGNIYLSDTTNERVRKITTPFVAGVLSLASSVITTVAGMGTAGSTGDGALAINAEIDSPEAVTLDSMGNLYIDTVGSGNAYIRKVTAATQIISTVVGKGAYGNTGDGGLALLATVDAEVGVALDPFGNMYISDTGNDRVRKVSLNTQFPATAVRAASAAQSVFLQPSAAITLQANGIASGFADFSAGSLTGCTLGSSAAAGSSCTTSVTFQPVFPGDRSAPLIATDSTGAKYIAGLTGRGFAPRLSFSPAAIKTFAGTGTAGYLGDGAAATSARINQPRGGVFDGAGNLYFADSSSNVIRKVSASGIVTTVAGNGTLGFSGDGGLATAAMLSGPTHVVIDAAGNLFIADAGNNRIREVSASTGFISTVAGGGTAGYTGDGGLAVSALLHTPTGLMFDSLGEIFIADTGNNAVRRFVPATGVITTFAGTGTAGYSGDGSTVGAATLRAPSGVTADDVGNVYIADTGNNVVRVATPSGIINTFAGTQTLTSNSGDGGSALSAGLRTPTDVTVDPAGDVYIMAGNQLRMVDTTNHIRTLAGSGVTGSYSGDGPSAPATILGVSANNIMLDNAGNVYVSDTSANLIVQVTSATASTLTFPDQLLNSNSGAQTVTVTNTGNQSLMFSADVSSTEFAQQASGGSDCSATSTVASGTSCVINVVFMPTSLGTQTGTITLTDNTLNLAGSSQVLGLTGKGIGTIGSTPQTISFSALSNVAYGSGPIALAATSSSGLGVVYTVTGPVTLSASTLTINGAGLVMVTASQGGNSTYAAATPVTQTFTVNPAMLTFTAASFTRNAGVANAPLTYSMSALVNGDPASVVTGMPALSTTATTASVVGTYPVVITAGTLSAANYTFVFVNGSITVTPVPVTDFTLTANTTSVTMQRGQVGLINLTMTPILNYAGTATLSCSPTPANVACVFLPPQLVGSGSTAVTIGSLSITTNASVSMNRSSLQAYEGLALAGLLFGSFSMFRRRRAQQWLLGVLLTIATVTLSGCVTQTTNIASAGTTQITVTATDAASNLTHSLTVNVTLQ